MSSLCGPEKSPAHHTPSSTPPDCGPGHRLSEATPATEAGEDSLTPGLLSPPGPADERWEPATADDTPQNQVCGDHGYSLIAESRQEVDSLTQEGSEATQAIPEGGLAGGLPSPGRTKAPESCAAERPAPDGMAKAQAKVLKTSKSTGEEGAEKSADKDVEANRGEEEAGPRLPNVALQMRFLEAVQPDLNTVNAQADRALQQLEHKYGQIRQYYLERRNYVIQTIPGFWVTALRNHPQLFEMITGPDAEMLRYITNLEVKESGLSRASCRFKFFFGRNPFFRNTLIVKDYEVRPTGQVVSLSTPIIWRPGHEPQPFIHGNQDATCNFFTWLSDYSHPEHDRMAQIIKEDLWLNPLQYYPLQAGAPRARRHQIREPVEIPKPFGFQSG